MTEKVTLHTHKLRKCYAKRNVVKEVSIQITQGEIVGILGPNGAGKTTTFYMIVGLVTPNAGKVKLGELDITPLAIHQRARQGISYLPQEASIFRNLSVYENIMAILQLQPELTTAQRKLQCEQLMSELNVTHLSKTAGASLSGGERRRVEIARALAQDPKFLLLDEPFAGIDPISVIEIKRIIHQLQQKNIGILITDHNVRETLDISERAYIINNGKVFAEGTAQDILQNQKVREVYLGAEFS